MRELGATVHELGAKLHVDGARIFNAAVALDVPAREHVAPADSVMLCLSKGLACPVGSIVAGKTSFIAECLRGRKLVGGGWRQAGVIAAAGLVALGDGPDGTIARLAEDHANARRLADALSSMLGVVPFDPGRATTNMVLFEVVGRPGTAAGALAAGALRARFMESLASAGVLVLEWGHREMRAVTHYGIDAGDIDRAIEACHTALIDCGAAPVVRAMGSPLGPRSTKLS
jgi:threonine aldolase